MPIPREQLRLTDAERDLLLSDARALHCATVDDQGAPHVAPLWFVWHDGSIWVNSLRKSRRGRDLDRGSPVGICIDAGDEYAELRGISADGRFEPVEDDETLDPVRRRFQDKYWHGVEVPNLRSHRWFRFVPTREASWDFRRIAQAGTDRRLEALRAQPPSVS